MNLEQAHHRLLLRDGEFSRQLVLAVGRSSKEVRWTSDLFVSRSRLLASVSDLFAACSPRFAPLADSPVWAMATRIVLEGIDSLGQHEIAADEVPFASKWTRDGLPTFDVTSSLLAELLLTDPSKISEEEVAFPFDAFRVLLPAEPAIKIDNGKGQLVAIRWIAVSRWSSPVEDPLSDERGVVEFGSTSCGLPKWVDGLCDSIERQSIKELESGLFIRAYSAEGIQVYHNQMWGSGSLVSDWMKATISEPNEVYRCNLETFDVDRLALSMLQRIVVNLALYLGSRDDGEKAPAWTPTSKSTGKSSKIWTVGSTVRIGPEVRGAAAAFARGESTKAPAIREIVRGHFKTQRHGKGLSEARRIRIRPYWRNPDGSSPRERVYKVS